MTNEVERFLKQIGKESNWPLFEKNGYTTIESLQYLRLAIRYSGERNLNLGSPVELEVSEFLPRIDTGKLHFPNGDSQPGVPYIPLAPASTLMMSSYSLEILSLNTCVTDVYGQRTRGDAVDILRKVPVIKSMETCYNRALYFAKEATTCDGNSEFLKGYSRYKRAFTYLLHVMSHPNIKDNEFILSEVKSAVSRLMKRAMEIKVHFMQSLESVKERNIKKDGKYRYDPSLGKDIFIPKISKLRYLTGTQILMIMKAQQKGVLPSRGTFAEMQPYSWLEEMISKKKKKDELERKQLKEKIVYEKECKNAKIKELLKQGRVNEVAQEAWKELVHLPSISAAIQRGLYYKEITNAIAAIDLSGDSAWLIPAIWMGECSLDSWCGLHFTNKKIGPGYGYTYALYLVHPTDGTRKEVTQGRYENVDY